MAVKVTWHGTALACVLAVVSFGCDRRHDSLIDTRSAPGTVWGPPAHMQMLDTFRGAWRLNAQVTGDPRVHLSDKPPAIMPVDGYRIDIDGHVINGSGTPQEQYRLFMLHEHDGWVCGRAWHHEDQHDPGDMSKCHVKFRRDGERLRMQVRMANRQVDDGDSDGRGESLVLSANASLCPLTNDVDYGWSEWFSYVYDRDKRD